MQGKAKIATCLFLGMLVAGLLARPEFAQPKTAPSGKQKFATAHPETAAAKPAPQPEVGKVILVLQTRDHRVTVRSGGGEELRYSVATRQGIPLADGLSSADLRSRFPGLHDVVTGTAWAGLRLKP